MENLTDDELAKILWDYNNLQQPLQKADCILVSCSNDLRVARYGAQLFLDGFAPLMVFAGNVGRLTEGVWKKPEAEMFADEAVKMGVPKDKIIIENQSTNTGENILFTKKLLEEKGINVSKVILVQKPYMLRRAFAAFKKRWPEVEVIVSGPGISYKDYPDKTISKELLINTMVGDTQRIKLYAEKGFQIPQEMPEKVWHAFEELAKRGYSKQLIVEEKS